MPENARALAFYRRHGFREIRALPAIPVHGSDPPLLIDWVEYAIELS